MSNGYSISNPTKRLLKSKEEEKQSEKNTKLLTKYYKKGTGEGKDDNDDGDDNEEDRVADEENYKLNSVKFTGKAVMKKLNNGEIRICIELNERQRREDLLRKCGLLDGYEKERNEDTAGGGGRNGEKTGTGKGRSSGGRGKLERKRGDTDDEYEEDYDNHYEEEEAEEHGYSEDDDHDDDKKGGKKNGKKDLVRSSKDKKKEGEGDPSISEACQYCQWSLRSRKEGLRFLMEITKEAREEGLLKSLISKGSAPNAPKFWIQTKKLALTMINGNGNVNNASQPGGMATDYSDLTTQLTVFWAPSETTELVSFYSIEYGGPVTSTVKKGDSEKVKYIEIYRDPEDAHPLKTFSFSYTLTGLSPGTSYRFRIRAVNGYGPGEYTYKTFTTITEAPLQPKVIRLSHDFVSLRWTFTKDFFERLTELKRIFAIADKDKSNTVDREELAAILDEKLSSSSGKDTDHLITFLSQIASAKGIDLKQGYGTLFDAMEVDDNGTLSWDEFEAFFMSAGWTTPGLGATTAKHESSLIAGSTATSKTGQTVSTAANSLAVRPGDIVYVVEKCEVSAFLTLSFALFLLWLPVCDDYLFPFSSFLVGI
jgi:hypothetical protein